MQTPLWMLTLGGPPGQRALPGSGAAFPGLSRSGLRAGPLSSSSQAPV